MQPRVGQSSSFEGGVAMIKEKRKRKKIYIKKGKNIYKKKTSQTTSRLQYSPPMLKRY
jgi:hypothetical protein